MGSEGGGCGCSPGGPKVLRPTCRLNGPMGNIHEANLMSYYTTNIPIFSQLDHLGGILGWDPVLTTCILGKILERIGTSHETQHGNHRVDHEKYCEAIYCKYHTSHHLTKISHTITFKTFFFKKIPFLLKTSKIPYYSTEDDIL